MKKRLLINGGVAVIVIITMILFATFCSKMKKVDRYNEMVEQYDTTTMCNKKALMPKIINLADSINGHKRQ